MKKRILIGMCAVGLAMSSIQVKAQQLPFTFPQNWQKSYGGTGNDGRTWSTAHDNDFLILPGGNMITVSSSESNSYPNKKSENSKGGV